METNLDKKSKKLDKHLDRGGVCSEKPSKTELEILHLLTEEFLTPRRIAIRRQTSRQAVSEIIMKLKKKGLINQYFKKLDKSLSTCQVVKVKGNLVRLHGQEFHINILYKDERYKEVLQRSNIIEVDGNTIRLFSDALEVYSGKSFLSEDAGKATVDSMNYFNRLFLRLESDLKVILLKPRVQNIRIVNAHYAETNNELAKECELEGGKLRVFTRDDGKLWFLIDNSFNLHEAESLHPVSSKPDFDRVKAVFNDYRDNPVPLPNEAYAVVKEVLDLLVDVTKHELELGAGLNVIVKLLQPSKGEVSSEKVFDKPFYVG